ncbi:hypothetical protein EC843_101165 [Buttiauxella sp. JUb87]|uniref:hypothetical protein n=1 Tax=Buttiauxella TaxID=82976 RepID=UPI00105D755B|nr:MULTISPECIES: hypothetical protein [Buttiauxella]TDN54124.1 hypothetical protein EC843_101165 [Buttiauxella sp. JUb87]
MDINHCVINFKDLFGLLLLLLIWVICVWDFISSCFSGRASFAFFIRQGQSAWLGHRQIKITGGRKQEKILYFVIMGLNLLVIVLYAYGVVIPMFSPSVFDELIGNIVTCRG